MVRKIRLGKENTIVTEIKIPPSSTDEDDDSSGEKKLGDGKEKPKKKRRTILSRRHGFVNYPSADGKVTENLQIVKHL